MAIQSSDPELDIMLCKLTMHINFSSCALDWPIQPNTLG